MSCGSHCFSVDVPGADPTCPIHGALAELREKAREEAAAEVQEQLEEQERRIAKLEEAVSSLRDALAGIRGYREYNE